MLLSYISRPSVVQQDILSNKKRSGLHAVVDCLFFYWAPWQQVYSLMAAMKYAMKVITINSDRDIHALCCSNFVASNAFVDKHSSSCHCSVPNSCTACFVHHSIIHIQVIHTDGRVAIGWTVEGDALSLADRCFTGYQLNHLRFNYDKKQSGPTKSEKTDSSLSLTTNLGVGRNASLS